MTREELQQKLHGLSEEKERAIREHDAKLAEIQEKHLDTLHDLEAWKYSVLAEIKEDRRTADSAMRKESAEEKTRYKLECMRIENERVQLFADYKAQQPGDDREETEKQ